MITKCTYLYCKSVLPLLQPWWFPLYALQCLKHQLPFEFELCLYLLCKQFLLFFNLSRRLLFAWTIPTKESTIRGTAYHMPPIVVQFVYLLHHVKCIACSRLVVYYSLLLGHWYEIMALYYVKSILTEISASREDKRVLQKSKVIRIKFFEHMGHATDV